MSATVPTPQAAQGANLALGTKGRQQRPVHESGGAYPENSRRGGAASGKPKPTVNLPGAKPGKQKGTGRARAGYKASPVWVGGGVVFGPHPRDYSKKVATSVKKTALRKALSERIKS